MILQKLFGDDSPTRECWTTGKDRGFEFGSSPSRGSYSAMVSSFEEFYGWLISPPLVMQADVDYVLGFWSFTTKPNENSYKNVLLSEARNVFDDFKEIWSSDNSAKEWVYNTIVVEAASEERVVYIGFRCGGGSYPYSIYSYYVDDILFRPVKENDLSLEEILTPVSGNNLTDQEEVKVRIRNMGSSPQSGFKVAFSIDGGSNWCSENFTGTIAANEIHDFSFSATVDLSAVGTHNLQLKITPPKDGYPDINILNRTIRNLGNTAVMGISGNMHINRQGTDFWDEGIEEDYSHILFKEDMLTFYPEMPGDKITVAFKEFYTLEERYFGSGAYIPGDRLYVYSGPNKDTENLLGDLVGDLSDGLPTFTSKSADGSLTFVFKQGAGGIYGEPRGWKAHVRSIPVEQPHDVYYTVTLDAAEGIRVNYANGDLTVEEGGHLHLIFYPEDPEVKAEDIILYIDGKEIPFRTQGTNVYSYILNPIERDCMVRLVIREKETVSNQRIGDPEIKLHANAGVLLAEASYPVALYVYTLTGVRIAETMVQGVVTLPLPAGAYLVKVGKETRKIIIP